MLQKEQNLVSKGRQLVRRHLSDEIIGDLVSLADRDTREEWGSQEEVGTTLPRSVMAAKRVASGSALDWRIPITVPHESFYTTVATISKLRVDE